MNNFRARCLNRELTREMIVGTFIGSVFIVMVVFTVLISGSRLFQGGRTKLDVTFEKVGGLRRHDSVLVRGVPIGKVDRLYLADSGVQVRLALNEPIRFRDGYLIKVQPTSLLGGMQLVIDEGAGEVLPPDTPLHGEAPDDVMGDVGALVNDLRGAMAEGGMLTRLKEAATDLSEITGRLQRGEGTLGRLLSTNDTLYAELEGSLVSIRKIADRLERGEGTLGKLLAADDTVYRDLQATMGDLRAIADRLEKGEGTLGKLLSEDDTLYKDLSASVASLKTVAGRIEAGEGALGQLLSKDSTLGKDVEGLVKDARATLDDMREASPITTFTSIFFGAF